VRADALAAAVAVIRLLLSPMPVAERDTRAVPSSPGHPKGMNSER